jgi:hypothetical protein
MFLYSTIHLAIVKVYVGIVSVNYLDPFIFGAKIPIRLLSCYTIINR